MRIIWLECPSAPIFYVVDDPVNSEWATVIHQLHYLALLLSNMYAIKSSKLGVETGRVADILKTWNALKHRLNSFQARL